MKKQKQEKTEWQQETTKEDLAWIKKMVNKTLKGKHYSVDEKNTLFSAGMEGYCQALQTFDPSHGSSFRGYASRRVCGNVIDEIRRNIGSERNKTKRPSVVKNYNFDLLLSETSFHASRLEKEIDYNRFLKNIKLPKKEKEILFLKIDGLSHGEISKKYGKSNFWSFNLLKKALDKLRSRYPDVKSET